MNYTIQNPEIFWKDFLQSADNASESIWIQVMQIEAGKKLQQLVPVLERKLKQGIKVEIRIDWVNTIYVHGNPSLLPELSKNKKIYNAQIHQKTDKSLRRLEKAGAEIVTINLPSLLNHIIPIMGRNHTKIYRADDTTWIGGVHPVDSFFSGNDLMVKFEVEKFEYVPQTDRVLLLDAHTKFMFDAGKIAQSIIYQEAISLVKNAKNSIVFMSQFLPDGTFLKELANAAKRGVKVEVITSPKIKNWRQGFPANIFYHINYRRATNKNISIKHTSKGVHAKLLIVDNKSVLCGSHNLSHIGVLLGTEECALLSQDPKLISQCNNYVKDLIF